MTDTTLRSFVPALPTAIPVREVLPWAIFAGLLLGWAARLGPQGAVQVPVSALLVFLVGRATAGYGGERIVDTLKKVEAAGFDEVILYFNVGLKPHQQVKDEMDRFMSEVAPAFEGAHKRRAA